MDTLTLRNQLLASSEATSSPDVVNAYSRILDHIFSEHCKNMQHMAFSSFSRIVNNPSIEHETLVKLVFHIINIAELLDLKYEFIDGEDSCFQISDEIIKEAQKTGLFGHPETGDLVESYEEKVFMYFTPSKKLRDIKDQTIIDGGVK